MASSTKTFGRVLTPASLLALVVLLWPADWNQLPATGHWVLVCTALLLFLVGFGAANEGRMRGIFLGRNNTISLTHTYTVLWSVLILGTLLTILALRLGAASTVEAVSGLSPEQVRTLVNDFQPFDIRIGGSLLALAGITTGSFVGAKHIAVKNPKQPPTPPTDVEALARDLLRNRERTLMQQINAAHKEKYSGSDRAAARRATTRLTQAAHSPGSLKKIEENADDIAEKAKAPRPMRAFAASAQPEQVKKAVELARKRAEALKKKIPEPRPEDASILDLLGPKHIDGRRETDLGRAQLLLFSIIAMVGFVITVWSLLGGNPCNHRAACVDGIPDISFGLVNLVGASHIGYLGSKAVGR